MKPIITVLPAALLMLQLYANFSGLSVQEQENAGCWSGFFASGRSEYLKTIVGCALLPERPYNVNLSRQAALCSLLKLYESHPEVKAYLQKHLKSVYPQTRYAFASRISETAQLELPGRKLISDRFFMQ